MERLVHEDGAASPAGERPAQKLAALPIFPISKKELARF